MYAQHDICDVTVTSLNEIIRSGEIGTDNDWYKLDRVVLQILIGDRKLHDAVLDEASSNQEG